MYAGRIVEMGPVRQIFTPPAHPYTRALLESIPRLGAARGPAHRHRGPAARPRARCPRGLRVRPALPARHGALPREAPPELPGRRRATWRAAGCTSRHDAAAMTRRPLLEVEGLTKHFPVRRGLLGRSTGLVRAVDSISFTHRGRAPRSAWSASRAAARPPRPSWSSASSGRPRGPSASRARTCSTLDRAATAPLPPSRPGRVPGSVRLARPAHARGHHRRRAAGDQRAAWTRPARRAARARAAGSGRPARARGRRSSRTSSRAASASASPSRGRSRCRRGSSCSTSRCPRSTCRSARRSSTCCAISRSASACRTSSSRTTSPRSRT